MIIAFHYVHPPGILKIAFFKYLKTFMSEIFENMVSEKKKKKKKKKILLGEQF